MTAFFAVVVWLPPPNQCVPAGRGPPCLQLQPRRRRSLYNRNPPNLGPLKAAAEEVGFKWCPERFQSAYPKDSNW